MMTVNYFRELIENGPYSWPGGYPVYFITSDGAALSFKAAEENAELIKESIDHHSNDDWHVSAVDLNFESLDLYCAHTGERIESAYCEED